jgi:hypothetical protein
MTKILSRLPAAALLAIMILILPVAALAQSFWVERNHGKTLALEIFKPSLHSGVYNGVSYPVDYSFQTVALFLSLRWPVGNKTFLVAELPFAHAAFDTKINGVHSFFRNRGEENTIGNPYLGLEIGSKASRFSGAAGIRLPLLAQDHGFALAVGAESDSDREEAFLDFAAIKVVVNYRLKREAGLVFRLRLGAAYLRKFENFVQGNGLFVTPAARIGYKTGRLSAGAYIIFPMRGTNVTSAEIRTVFTRGSNFSFKLTQEEGLWANISLGKLQPGVRINTNSFALNLGVQL